MHSIARQLLTMMIRAERLEKTHLRMLFSVTLNVTKFLVKICVGLFQCVRVSKLCCFFVCSRTSAIRANDISHHLDLMLSASQLHGSGTHASSHLRIPVTPCF